MSAHSPRLQFLTKLLDSPKTEAKGVVLVKGSWYATRGSPRLPFNLNQSILFPDLSPFFCFGMFHISLGRGCIDIPTYLMICRQTQTRPGGQLGGEGER